MTRGRHERQGVFGSGARVGEGSGTEWAPAGEGRDPRDGRLPGRPERTSRRFRAGPEIGHCRPGPWVAEGFVDPASFAGPGVAPGWPIARVALDGEGCSRRPGDGSPPGRGVTAPRRRAARDRGAVPANGGRDPVRANTGTGRAERPVAVQPFGADPLGTDPSTWLDARGGAVHRRYRELVVAEEAATGGDPPAAVPHRPGLPVDRTRLSLCTTAIPSPPCAVTEFDSSRSHESRQ